MDVFSHLTLDGDPLRALIAAAQEDEGFRTVFRERFVLPREKIVTALLQRAQQRGSWGRNGIPKCYRRLFTAHFGIGC